MRAFIYGRFSSHKQQELSIEAQIDICREYAEKHNITVVGEYVDRARSARTENRADFRRLIRDACTGVVDCVLVWRYDRFSVTVPKAPFTASSWKRPGFTLSV